MMFSSEIYIYRRRELAKSIKNGLILICGNTHSPRNYSANYYPFRQDSNFLYFTGIDLPNLFLLIDVDSGSSTLFGDEFSIEESIWIGKKTSLVSWAEKSGIDYTKPNQKLKLHLDNNSHQVHFLPAYSVTRKLFLADILEKSVAEICSSYSEELVKAVVKQRSIKSDEEVKQIEEVLDTVTARMHINAMKMAMPNTYEYEIAAQIQNLMLENNLESAYATICSVRGDVLHNETYANCLKSGQLLLVDAGAESSMHYASDITRTTPVGGKFNSQQKAIYSIVLNALLAAENDICQGIHYRTIHLVAAKTIVKGLIDMGIMKGNADDAVSCGAYALFFPHGIGHMLGLDVHDMEDLGENFVGYDETISRSKQFGLSNLRMARKLESGFVVTVEPGIYFISALIEKWKNEKKFLDFINYSEVAKFIGLGGVRIEDNVVVQPKKGRILGRPIPKSISDIENLF